MTLPDELLPLPFPSETDGLKGWRCNVPVGWVSIVNDLHEEIAALIPGYALTQVKEKFGGLRYHASFPEEISADVRDQAIAAIRRAEQRSMVTCDICGDPGRRIGQEQGWWRTRCGQHPDAPPEDVTPQ